MIPTFNGRPEYIRQTITSVLSQDPGADHMQIRLVDNGSSKHDYKALAEELGGSRIEYHRHPETLRYLDNFNSCIEMARGELVHLLHDDDLVEPGFYDQVEKAYDQHPEVGYLFTRHKFINEEGEFSSLSPLERESSGILENWIDSIGRKQSVYYASVVVPRAVYLREGCFNSRFVTCAEDWEMWVRLASRYPVYFITEPLSKVRIHSNSMSKSLFQSGSLISESRKAIQIFEPMLPAGKRSQIARDARNHIARVAYVYANSYAGVGETRSAVALTREALLTSQSPTSLIKAIESSLRIALSIFRKPKASK